MAQISPQALTRITELAALPFDWDGYGSPSPHAMALDGAIHVLELSAHLGLLAPYMGPVTGGGIQLEWHMPNRELELEILPDGSLEYVAICDHKDMREGTLPTYNHNGAADLMHWLARK